ncbi:MAG: alpha/beta fold hydrolase [Alphaproteobacteria bacterium]|nr:alpha/beta fold hydrolase [Alphaproteobacteria bacterium]
MDWNHQYAGLPDLRVHYVRHGQGDPLFLIHGWPEFWYAWHKNIPTLAKSFDVIVPDLRGFGDTEKTDGVPGVMTYAEDLQALADHLGIGRFGVATHDVGAGVMQVFARQWPERLTGLFLFNASHPGVGKRWAEADHLKEIWYQSFHQLDFAEALVGASRESCRTYFQYFLSHWAHDPHAYDDDLEAWVDNFMKPGNLRGGFDWYRATNESRLAAIRGDVPILDKITVPTRMLWGAHDPVLKAEWRDRLGDYFADIRIDVAEEAGHFVHYEVPDLANLEIEAFFKSLRG